MPDAPADEKVILSCYEGVNEGPCAPQAGKMIGHEIDPLKNPGWRGLLEFILPQPFSTRQSADVNVAQLLHVNEARGRQARWKALGDAKDVGF